MMIVNSLVPSRMGTIDSMRVWLKAWVCLVKRLGTSVPRARSALAGAAFLVVFFALARGSELRCVEEKSHQK